MSTTTNGHVGCTEEKAVCCFGVLADVQYADTENGTSYDKTRRRYYRHAIDGLDRAIRHVSEQHVKDGKQETSFILQLGDLIDGKSRSMGKTQEALNKIETIFKMYKHPIHHAVGNHELYNFNKTELKNTYLHRDQNPESPFYYDFEIAPGFRLVLLDCYDFGVLGIGKEGEEYEVAKKFLLERNHNPDWNASDDLHPGQCHFTAYNGGIGRVQMEWLEKVLREAEKKGEKVILSGHVPLHVPYPYCTNLVWNYEEVLEVVHRYPCVVVYMCGHDHDGGYFQDEQGVHHVIIQAILETEPGKDAFGLVYVHEDKLVIEGHGRVPNRELHYRKS